MALQNDKGYVRIAISTSFSDDKLTVRWMTFFDEVNWKEQNPARVFRDIIETGSYTFDLSIKEKQMVTLEEPYEDNEGNLITEEEQDVVIGIHPQTMDTAHTLLMDLDVNEARFAVEGFIIV